MNIFEFFVFAFGSGIILFSVSVALLSREIVKSYSKFPASYTHIAKPENFSETSQYYNNLTLSIPSVSIW